MIVESLSNKKLRYYALYASSGALETLIGFDFDAMMNNPKLYKMYETLERKGLVFRRQVSEGCSEDDVIFSFILTKRGVRYAKKYFSEIKEVIKEVSTLWRDCNDRR